MRAAGVQAGSTRVQAGSTRDQVGSMQQALRPPLDGTEEEEVSYKDMARQCCISAQQAVQVGGGYCFGGVQSCA